MAELNPIQNIANKPFQVSKKKVTLLFQDAVGYNLFPKSQLAPSGNT